MFTPKELIITAQPIQQVAGIYIIYCIANEKCYIGSSISIKTRIMGHKSKLNTGKHDNSHLQKSWEKYGKQNFIFRILETYFDFRKSYPMSDLCELGYFELRSDQLEAPLKCYAVAPTAQRLFGVMALNLDAKLLKDEDDFSYKATIASKAVVWRYLLVNREPLVYKDFKLYSGKTVLSLKEEYVTELGNGENAYLLETTEPITMAERYEHFYELEFVKQDPKTGQVAAKKRIGLPVPDITKVKISKSERGYKAYSDMYIYL